MGFAIPSNSAPRSRKNLGFLFLGDLPPFDLISRPKKNLKIIAFLGLKLPAKEGERKELVNVNSW